MRCQEFREMMDSYLGDELLVETNHEVLRHLEDCPACRSELAAQRGLLTQMRLAVKNAPEMQINSAFAARLRTSLRETTLKPGAREKFWRGEFFNFKLLTTVAASLLAVSLFAALWLNRASSLSANETIVAENNQPNRADETIPSPAESPIARAVQAARREAAHAAIGDHENCALDFRLVEDPITLDEAARKYGRFNKDLDKAVIAAVTESPARKFAEKSARKFAEKIELSEAHSCVFQGRRFAHVVLKYRSRVVSILVTDTDLPDDGESIANLSDGSMQAASFSAAHHAVFVVSDLTEAENAALARIISPSVRRHIEQAAA